MPHPEQVDESLVTYEIDGDRIQGTDDFYTVVGEAVNGPGGYFGRNLDALRDCLHGGFGTPEAGGFRFIWRHSQKSRATLGYAETVRQLERKLDRCHPANRPFVRQELVQARKGEGPSSAFATRRNSRSRVNTCSMTRASSPG